MKKNLLINLPKDVFIDNVLLSKVLPMKSLLSLKCVCKYLRKLITSPAFIKMQLHANQVLYNDNQLVLLHTTDHYGIVFRTLKFNTDGDPSRPEVVNTFVSSIEGQGTLKIWGSCNGLLCFTEGDNVCLWNPFTKEYKDLPPSFPLISTEVPRDFGTITYGFGYDRLLDVYKVIRCRTEFLVERQRFEDHGDKHTPIITEFQVYTLGTKTWRMISSDNNPYKYYYILSLKSVVFVNGALHWIMSTSNWFRMKSSSEKTEAKILSFDIETEVFQEIQAPLTSYDSYKVGQIYYPEPELQVLRECLCVLELDSSTKSYCNVWMMMDYGAKGSWTKLFKIEFFNQIRLTHHRLLRFCENGTKILVGSFNTLLVYDPVNNKARRVDIGNFGCPGEISGIYIESLVSLNSGVYKGMPLKRKKRKQAH